MVVHTLPAGRRSSPDGCIASLGQLQGGHRASVGAVYASDKPPCTSASQRIMGACS